MGYSTEFTGELKFTTELAASQLAYLNTILGEDCRDHPEWGATHLTYVDLEILPDFSGLKWDGSEKTYDLAEKVNLITTLMATKFDTFGLSGKLIAQGEEFDDRWALVMDDCGIASKRDIVIEGAVVECPDCGCRFILE